MSASINLDDSLWPLLTIQFIGVNTDQRFTEYLDECTRLLSRREPFVCILDCARSGVSTSDQRHMQSQWLLRHDAALRKQMLGCACIVTSAPMRLVVSLVLHVSPMPCPYVIVSSQEAAVRYVAGRLEESGFGAHAERVRQRLGPRAG